jgi:AAA ATPase domain
MAVGPENLDAESLEFLGALSERFSAIVDASFTKDVRDFGNNLASSVKIEGAESRVTSVAKKLAVRLPKFLFFGEEDRSLKSSYSMSELTAEIPLALQNLAKVAECDLGILSSVYAADVADPKIDTMIEKANEKLAKNFRAVWKQSAISLALSLRDQQLLIQVRNKDNRRTDLAQRSDGLRQFVALQCFTASKGADDMVLLIDEAEQHLHYDAQADLIQMLASQTVAPKVIYSTHSAGCLPEDLGNGVRLVLPIPDSPDWSKIENKFWHKGGGSFSPLLIGMGASTLAFLPMRLAVVVEGEADMLLYPTMFREALDTTSLGVQFVPGLSQVSIPNLPLLNSSGKRVCYLVDGDNGGRKLEKDLVVGKIEGDRIFRLFRPKGDCELEDFVNSIVLTSAVNEIGRLYHRDDAIILPKSMPKFGKWDHIVASCKAKGVKPFSKVEVAYGLLDVLDADPSLKILEPSLAEGFAKLALEIVNRVKSEAV